jgi:hypothetical protein
VNVPKLLSGLLLGAVLLTGCSSDSDQAATASSESGAGGGSAGGDGERSALAPAEPGGDTDSTARDGAADESAGGGADTAVDLRVAPGAALIRTADVEVRVDDVQESAESAARIARDAGGRVEAEDRSGLGRDRSASVQLRVPSDRFDAVLADLSELGDEQSRHLSSEDVSEQVIDLEARLATQRASVDRVRALLDEADALGQVVQIEGELTRRTADLESLQARLQALEGAVSLSTIVLRLHSQDGPVVGEAWGFGDGLRTGWAAVVTVGRVLAVSAGALLPFLPLLLLAGWLLVRRNRRGGVRAPRPSVPETAAP